MLKLLSLLNFSTFKENIIFIFKRFSVSIVYLIFVNLLFLSLIHFDLKNVLLGNVLNGIFSLIIGVFFSLGMYLLSEGLSLNKLKTYFLQIVVFLYILFFYFGFSENYLYFDKILFFIINIFGIITFLFFAPFLKNIFDKNYDKDLYFNYFYNISFSFFISFVFGGILFLLGVLGIFTTISLFDIGSIGDKIIGDWAVFSLGFVSVLFGLTKIPKKENIFEKKLVINSFFSFIVKYIAIPFIYIYFLILYTYSVKVLMNFGDWPKGEVSWMVILFSIFGYLIYIFSYVFENENKFIKFFRKLFPFVVFPQLFMLFYAIFLRINQYDITINRYFVVVFGIWLFIITLYFIFSQKKNLIFIPFFITIFTIIISVGPWGVYSLPESRQLNLLNQNLTKANILQNGQIIPLKNNNDIPQDLSKNIYNQINYLCSINNCKSIKKLFEKEYNVFLQKHKNNFNFQNIKSSSIDYNEPNSWEIVNHLTEYLKVYSYFDQSLNEVLFIENIEKNIFPIETKGFTKISKVCPECSVKINYSTNKLEIYKEKELKKDFDISKIFQKLQNDKNKKENNLSFEIDGNKLILNNISIKNLNSNSKTNQNYYYSYEGYFLEK